MSHQNSLDGLTNGSDLLCFICQDFLCKPCTTPCGHTFCYLCLDQYFVYSEVLLSFPQICPKCSKSIRGKPLNPVPSLAEYIQNLVRDDSQEFENFLQRKEVAKKYMKKRQLQGIKVGMVLDVRDSNNIWVEGMVIRVITKLDESVRYLKINYLSYLQKKEEDIQINSQRLAPKGFFTSRRDIPHYGQIEISPIITKYQL